MRMRSTLTAEDLTLLLVGNRARPRVEGARATPQLEVSRLVELSALRQWGVLATLDLAATQEVVEMEARCED